MYKHDKNDAFLLLNVSNKNLQFSLICFFNFLTSNFLDTPNCYTTLEKGLLEKAATIKIFEYSLLGSELKSKKTL